MADRRYGSEQWKRLRRAILHRDGYACRLQGPTCVGVANTVHHIEPSSRRPDLFWEPANLISACGACNYADGARVKAANERQRVAELQEVIRQQADEIRQLVEQLEEYEAEHPNPLVRQGSPNPAIY
jgi:5-methylcytosine-specific restriction endonuclease McrA